MHRVLPLLLLLIAGCPAGTEANPGQAETPSGAEASQPEPVVSPRGWVEKTQFTYFHLIDQDGPGPADAQRLQKLLDEGWRVVDTVDEVLLINVPKDGKVNVRPGMVKVTQTLHREWN